MKIYNSLMWIKNDFILVDLIGEVVMWYVCGFIVYEDVYLGYVKNYVLIDIICCIMRDYFGF